MTTISARELPIVVEDEDGERYYAVGHIDARAFVLGVLAYLLDVEVPADAIPKIAEMLNDVRYVWFRYDRLPEDDEHMALCESTDEGAEPFTMIDLEGLDR